jgi:hypothetical protein
MRHIAATLALLCLPLMALADSVPPRELIADAELRIAADGTVAGYHLDGWLEQDLARALEKQVTSWRFEPAQVDGHPAEARTHVLVTLQPKQLAPGTAVWQITDVSVGEPALARRRLLMPDYPLAALRAHLGARVVVVVRLNAAGKITAVHAEQTSLTSPGNDTLAAQWREIFEDVTLRAAKGWKFRPVESVAGAPVGTTIRIPVVFVYYGDRAHRYYPGPIVPAPWLVPAAGDDAARDALAEGEIEPLESRVRLSDDVVGRTL